jgi:hypothetical protein
MVTKYDDKGMSYRQQRLVYGAELEIAEALTNQRFAKRFGLGMSYKQMVEYNESQNKKRREKRIENFKYFLKIIFALLGLAVLLVAALAAIGVFAWTSQPMSRLDEIYWLLVIGLIILINKGR